MSMCLACPTVDAKPIGRVKKVPPTRNCVVTRRVKTKIVLVVQSGNMLPLFGNLAISVSVGRMADAKIVSKTWLTVRRKVTRTIRSC